jgi:nucleoside phosphorylase
MAAPKFRPEDYTVGWICALPIELYMVRAMLDLAHHPLESQPSYDENHYHLGEIGKHKVVITCLADYSTTSAAVAAKSMQATFGELRFGLLVGVGGGIPSPQVDIRLGDIAVSLPTGQHGGVLQYDLGRMRNDGFHRVGSLNRPPKLLLGVLPTMRSTLGISKEIFAQAVKVLDDAEEKREVWAFPGASNDILFKAESEHVAKNPTCVDCIDIVPRDRRKQNWPKIHYGNIASGNTVIKSPEMRDRLGEEENAICVDMAAAGVMNDFPCLVIRGISNYSDSHQNSNWQPYAAAVATVYAKKLLQEIPPMSMQTMNTTRRKWSACSLKICL